MTYAAVPNTFGPKTVPVLASLLDANFSYLAAKILSVKDFGAVGNAVTDDTAAIQAALNSSTKPIIYFPKGTYIVSSVLTAPTGTRLIGEQREGTLIQRTATHTGHTLVVGSAIAPASSIDISGLTFVRPITFTNGGISGQPYIAGTSTAVDHRLTSGQAHLQVWIAQGAVISECVFRDMPIAIDLRGCLLTTVRDCTISGSIYDYQTVALQEGVAGIQITEASGTSPSTLITIDNCVIGGGYASAVRNVSIGTIVAAYAENVGMQYGIKVTGVEGLVISNSYIGGQDTYSIYLEAQPTVICSNIKIANNFFDGARFRCIHFDKTGAGGASILVTIANNCFNGESATSNHIYANNTANLPSLYQATISGNTMMACNFAAIALVGALGVMVTGNVVGSYNVRGGNTGAPDGSAGCYVVLGASNSDKVFTSGNIWGGGLNTLGGTNNCQYGVYFSGSAVTDAGASGERSAQLGLGGGALVNIAQTYPA